MSKLYSAFLLCEKHSKTIAVIGQSLANDCWGGGVEGDLSLINHPCYLLITGADPRGGVGGVRTPPQAVTVPRLYKHWKIHIWMT